MATKIFCDGCDKDTTAAYNTTNVCIGVAATDAVANTYDLCNRCIERLRKEANPLQWARAV